MIKAILLDVDNTLLDFNKCACAAMQDAARDFSLALPEEAFSAFRRINDGLWRQIEEQTLTTDELYRIRWARIFRELGIDFDGPAFEARFYRYLTTAAEKVDGADELMAHLQGKYILCIASNAPYLQQVRMPQPAAPAMSAVSESPIISTSSGRKGARAARQASKKRGEGLAAPISSEIKRWRR